MKLTRARVTNFKSVEDSGWVTINGVTCMVGKNESGKTAFLNALRRLNPVPGARADFDLKDYPRKGYVRYKRAHKTEPAIVVRGVFELSEQEVEEIQAVFGEGVLTSSQLNVAKDFANQRHWDFEVNEQAVVHHVLRDAGLPPEIQQHAENSETLLELGMRLETLDVRPPSVEGLLNDLTRRFKTDVRQQIIENHFEKYMPRFVYFDDYSTMRGRISIQDIRKRQQDGGPLDDADRTFLSLIDLAGAEMDDLENQVNYEHLKAELESASIGISDEVFQFWNQNKQLRVEFDLSSADPNDPPPLNSGTILHVRIWNNRHRVSVPFDERSKGFVWFFSFLAYFSKLEEEDDSPLTLLLDEPGLNLHAMAQGDFLQFIDERLAPKHQVIYTTHSPFMIDLKHLDRVRTVQDVDEVGTIIRDDTLSNDQETIFPLQVALSYQTAQTLFLAPHCLMVNCASDLIYVQVLGEILASKGRQRLDPRWVVIPVGGADNLPAFLSLLGENYVSVAVLMDVTPKNKERMEKINQNGIIRRRNPIKWVEVTRIRDADIEDLFDANFYLRLVNEVYAAELPAQLTLKAITDSNPRIVQRIQSYFENEGIADGQFDSYRAAAFLLQKHAELRDQIDDSTIERAASMFERINSLLPEQEKVARMVNGGHARSMATAL